MHLPVLGKCIGAHTSARHNLSARLQDNLFFSFSVIFKIYNETSIKIATINQVFYFIRKFLDNQHCLVYTLLFHLSNGYFVENIRA